MPQPAARVALTVALGTGVNAAPSRVTEVARSKPHPNVLLPAVECMGP